MPADWWHGLDAWQEGHQDAVPPQLHPAAGGLATERPGEPGG